METGQSKPDAPQPIFCVPVSTYHPCPVDHFTNPIRLVFKRQATDRVAVIDAQAVSLLSLFLPRYAYLKGNRISSLRRMLSYEES